jgi:hypothetical protein
MIAFPLFGRIRGRFADVRHATELSPGEIASPNCEGNIVELSLQDVLCHLVEAGTLPL